ncbi:NAD(P)-dependent dehydrogenase, short-chain alcohol dehydrogenase family [Tistlia consotensis]|uniref:NAD(P)-dependent dehydrogenase, short-chain alcohol dehydrogenase family n=1 Tax=Tistlia consotensis USBA 355 TaxID=560819 RepID=A0A1Y6C1J1_9PROT|nr:SDR family oxidoreductase [Tistlia consotensis]SMF36915.1 NAD(P)-dependent dehydrogenase, short-chain alcohol dehydrogenase family [Tistlia consotensis USBA 355]SNR72333.1 NAD(P)-dependent dehydrogenase, short-chain alcohol dehydrogenase family [Tistlia consotensis]
MTRTHRLAGKAALVMGGGSSNRDGGHSNGQASALTYAREGAGVVVADVNLEAARATVAEIEGEGGTAVAVAADVRSSAQVKAAADAALEAFGRIDVLHNNAGIEYLGNAVDTPEEAWDNVHAVNIKGVFLACKHVIPVMAGQGGGSIVNISSTASLRWGGTSFLAYNSSKAALNHFSRIMAREHAPQKVRINVVIPGMIDTPHIRTLYRHLSPEELAEKLRERDAKCPIGRQGTCWDVANAALFFASDESAYVTGAQIIVDGGLSI